MEEAPEVILADLHPLQEEEVVSEVEEATKEEEVVLEEVGPEVAVSEVAVLPEVEEDKNTSTQLDKGKSF